MVKVRIFVAIVVFIGLQAVAFSTSAQCAMCRATLENNVSHGEAGMAPGLNTGILYLFAMPYILVGVIGFLWYKNSKRGKAVRHQGG